MILEATQKFASILPTNYDRLLPLTFGGPFGLQWASFEVYLDGSLLTTITFTFEDDEYKTATNTDGDVWTVTYDSKGRISDWVKT